MAVEAVARIKLCLFVVGLGFAAQPCAQAQGKPKTGTMREEVVILPWATATWIPARDKEFLPIRLEIDAAIAKHGEYKLGTDWPKRAREAANQAIRNPTSLFLLYKATMFYQFVKTVEPSYNSKNFDGKPWIELRRLWTNIKHAPNSFEFSRAGYLFNAGYTSSFRMGELGKRVLAKEPKNRWVVLAYVQDAGGHGDGPGCWERAYDVMKTFAAGRSLTYRDHWHVYLANFYMWRLKEDKAFLSAGLKSLDVMLATVPAGSDPTRVKSAREHVVSLLEKATKP